MADWKDDFLPPTPAKPEEAPKTLAEQKPKPVDKPGMLDQAMSVGKAVMDWPSRQVEDALKIGKDLTTGVFEIGRTAGLGINAAFAEEGSDAQKAGQERVDAVVAGAKKGVSTIGKAATGDMDALGEVTKFLFPGWVRLYNDPSSIIHSPVATAWDLATQAGPTPGTLGAFATRAGIGAAKAGAGAAAKVAPQIAKNLPNKVNELERAILPKVNFTPEMRNIAGKWEGTRFLAKGHAEDTARQVQKMVVDEPAVAESIRTVAKTDRKNPIVLRVGDKVEEIANTLDELHTRLAKDIRSKGDRVERAKALTALSKHTELSLDPQTGMPVYGQKGAYQALSPADKARVDWVREQLSAPVVELYAMGGLNVRGAVQQILKQVDDRFYADLTSAPGKRAFDVLPDAERAAAEAFAKRHRATIPNIGLGDETISVKSAPKVPGRQAPASEFLESLLEPDYTGKGNNARNRELAKWRARYGGETPKEIDAALGNLGDMGSWVQKGVPGSLQPGEAAALSIAHTVNNLNSLVNNRKALMALKDTFSKDGMRLVIQEGDVVPKRVNPKTGVEEGWYKELHLGETGMGVPIKENEKFYYHPDAQDLVEIMRDNVIPSFATSLIKSMKWAATVPSLKTWVGNIASNVQYTTVAGASMANPRNWGHYQDALKHLVESRKAVSGGGKFSDIGTVGDPLFKEALKRGLVVPAAVNAELAALYGNDLLRTRNLEGYMEKGHALLTQNPASRAAGHLYELQDMVARYGAFRALVKGGKSLDEAQSIVYASTPSYTVSSHVGRFLRGEVKLKNIPAGIGPAVSGPFATFPLEHARIMKWAAKNHPGRLMVAAMMPTAFKTGMLALTGTDMAEWNSFQDSLRQNEGTPTEQILSGFPPDSRKVLVPGWGWRSGKDAMVFDTTNWWPTDQAPLGGLTGNILAGAAGRFGQEMERIGPTAGIGDVPKAAAKAMAPTWLRDTVSGAYHGAQGTTIKPNDSRSEPLGPSVSDKARVIATNVGRAVSPVRTELASEMTEKARQGAKAKIAASERRKGALRKRTDLTDEDRNLLRDMEREYSQTIKEKR